MAGLFVRASTTYLEDTTPPFLAPPFTIAAWVYPSSTTPQSGIWSLGDITVNTNLFMLSHTTVWVITAVAAGATSNGTGGSVVANAWHFLVGRFISSANRKLDVLQSNGSIAAVSNTASSVPTGITTARIGNRAASANLAFDGLIGEFWCTNTDIQGDGAALQAGFLRQLAYGGPFSVPSVAASIVEYRGMRTHPTGSGDVHFGAFGAQNWVNNNGVTTGPHPPLPYWYEKPRPNLGMSLV